MNTNPDHGGAGREGITMNTNDRRRQFDELYRLRSLYRLRGDGDRLSVISIEAVVEQAERRLDDPDLLVETLGPNTFEPERKHA